LFLKCIEIYGFKSFAEKTTMIFKPGVTAIVGPNGCGKSNILDAIRWVLGESNARSLRGEVMDDVIFSGSDGRKPLGMAEVGLTMVNDDGLLPVEYSEVNIKRRLYRSGESEFFLNKNSVRMREILDLFADTGIGKPAYSVMEQGNIDILLSNKPAERMAIFEEAAGITRYKLRMKESYKRLAATEENLVRLNLILNEVEKEYISLEKQAHKAAQYRELKRKEVEYETIYNYMKIKEIEEKIDKNNSTLEELKKKKSEIENYLQDLNLFISRNMDRIKELEREIVQIKSNIYRRESDLETINAKMSHIKDRIQYVNGESEKKVQLAHKLKKLREEAESKLDKLKKEKKSVSDLIFSQEEKLNACLGEIEFITRTLEKAHLHIEEKTEEVELIQVEIQKKQEELKKVTDRLLKELDNIRSSFEHNERKKNELVITIGNAVSGIDGQLKRLITRLQDLSFMVRIENTGELIGEITEQITRIRQKLEGLKTDINTVINIQDNLSQVIFGKEGLHSKKSQIEENIEQLLIRIDSIKKVIEELTLEVTEHEEKKVEFNSIINNLRPDIARNKERINHFQDNITRLVQEISTSEESLQDVELEIKTLTEHKKQLELEIHSLMDNLNQVEEERISLNQKIEKYNKKIDTLIAEIQNTEAKANKERNRLDQLNRQAEKLELQNAELSSRARTIKETFKERYSVSLELFEPQQDVESHMVQQLREEVRIQLQNLGQVNLMAQQEFKAVKERYDYLTSQKQDLEEAKKDICNAMERTLQSSKAMFMESFENIKKNFNAIFRRLFNGGTTDLFLTNESNIFESGVEIMACPPGKSLKRRSLLSGGEKGLTAIALLFAIFMVKPSPFCILDEVDHDLDEENIIRFLKLLKEFTDTTQFIIITHNRRTIEFADVIYGVTSEEAGVSKVVSLDLMEHTIE